MSATRDGVVYQKDLGSNTANLAAAMTEFNPDNSWISGRSFFTDMEAPEMTAPVGSATVPSKVPRKVWAVRMDVDTAAKKTESTSLNGSWTTTEEIPSSNRKLQKVHGEQT